MGRTSRRFKGIIPPVFTPFKPDKEIDEDSFSSLIKFLIDAGVHGLWIEGSGGEFSSLSIEERKKLYKLSIEEAKDKVPILAGVSHSSTKVATELAKYAEGVGVDAITATPPYYFPSSASSLFKYYKAICESVDIPVVLYDNFGCTKQILSINLIEKIVQELGIHSIKVCSYPRQTALEKAIELKRLLGEEINILIASAQFAYYAFSMDVAEGSISMLLNVIPHDFVRMYEAIKSGDDATAREIHYKKILPLGFFGFYFSNEEVIWIQVGKMILKWCGVISHETVRDSLSPLKNWQIKYLRDMAEYTGLI